jgi:hypothetical protein
MQIAVNAMYHTQAIDHLVLDGIAIEARAMKLKTMGAYVAFCLD